MLRIDDPTAVAALPTPEVVGTEGYFFEGDPANNKQATNVRASWLNMIQEELRAIVVAGGLTPSKTTYNQVLTAIRNIAGVPAVWGGVSGGSANAQVINPTAPITTLRAGQQLNFICGISNTGSLSVNVSGLGAVAVRKAGVTGQVNMAGGEWQVNNEVAITFDGSVWQWNDNGTINPYSFGTMTHNGNVVVNGDIYSVRSGGTSGVVFLNSAGSKYLYFDGTNYALPGGELYVNGVAVTAGISNAYSLASSASAAAGTAQTTANNAQNQANNAVNLANNAQNSANAANNNFVNYVPNISTGNTGLKSCFYGIQASSSFTLPPGGSWIYSFLVFNASGQCLFSVQSQSSGGTVIFNTGGATAQGWALRVN
jgi:hypothetical protein